MGLYSFYNQIIGGADINENNNVLLTQIQVPKISEKKWLSVYSQNTCPLHSMCVIAKFLSLFGVYVSWVDYEHNYLICPQNDMDKNI